MLCRPGMVVEEFPVKFILIFWPLLPVLLFPSPTNSSESLSDISRPSCSLIPCLISHAGSVCARSSVRRRPCLHKNPPPVRLLPTLGKKPRVMRPRFWSVCVCPNIVMERQIRRPLWSDHISSNRSFDQFHAENRVLVHRTWHTKGTQWHVAYSSTVILLFEMEANKAPSVINSFTHVPGKELLPIRTIMQHQKWNLSQCFCENC